MSGPGSYTLWLLSQEFSCPVPSISFKICRRHLSHNLSKLMFTYLQPPQHRDRMALSLPLL